MSIYIVENKKTIAPLFAGWDETMIWSCLDDCLGIAYADDLVNPVSVQIITGPFSFFGGKVNEELIRNNLDFSFDIVPQNHEWEQAIEAVYKEKIAKRIRYSTHKNNTFPVSRLEKIVAGLPEQYEIREFDPEVYQKVIASSWSEDMCENYKDYEDFNKNGIGFVIMEGDEVVSGASAFTYYNGGIEIQIDTREDKQRNGLALVCGAKLILACLDKNLYPSWDAHNLGSLAVAEKLGYTFNEEYTTYEFVENVTEGDVE